MNDNSPAYVIERTLPCKTVAEILGFHVSTIYRLIEEGELEACGQKRRKRIYESSIERYRRRNKYEKDQNITRERFRVTGNRHKEAMKELNELLA